MSSLATDLQLDVSDTNGTWDVFMGDTLAGKTTLVSVDEAGTSAASASPNIYCSITPDATRVVFTSTSTDHQSAIADDNAADDIFLRDLSTQTTVLVSVDQTGLASGDAFSFDPYVSSDGRIVAFTSVATNLVGGVVNGNGGDVDVYQRDLSTGETTLLSLSVDGVTAGSSWSYFESLSGP